MIYENTDRKCECWKCERSYENGGNCPYYNKLQRLPTTDKGGLGLCPKLKEEMNNQYLIRGVVITFEDNEPHCRDEAIAYFEHARKQHGNRIKSLIIRRGKEFTDLNYILINPPFERIRRITGYLVGTTERWNDAKKAELKDRVKHDE